MLALRHMTHVYYASRVTESGHPRVPAPRADERVFVAEALRGLGGLVLECHAEPDLPRAARARAGPIGGERARARRRQARPAHLLAVEAWRDRARRLVAS